MCGLTGKGLCGFLYQVIAAWGVEQAVRIHPNSDLNVIIYSSYSLIHSSDVPTVSFISTSNAPMKVSGKGLGTKPNHLLTFLHCGQPQLPSQNN